MNADSYPMTNIVAPGDHDALCGRGGHTIHWNGNIKFRALVEQHRDRYHSASRVEKGKVVAEVVQMWRKMTPPGRFLTLTDPKLGDASPWHDIGDKSAQKKTAKRLREGHSGSSSTSSVTCSDEDSTTSGHSTKRHVRRVSNDSMERAAKRVRRELSAEQVPMLALNFLEDRLSEVSSQDDIVEPWAPIKTNVLEEGLDLDCLFDDIQPEPVLPEPTLDADTTFWQNCNFTVSSFGGSPLLNDIAVSIPSAACLTESIFFD